MAGEGVELGGPEMAVVSNPSVELSEAVGTQGIHPALLLAADRDQAGLAEDAEVTGDTGLTGLGKGAAHFTGG